MAVLPTTFSPATIAEEFIIVRRFELEGLKLAVIFERAKYRAAVINMTTERLNGGDYHRVIVMLRMTPNTALGQNGVETKRLWIDDAYLIAQVEDVTTDVEFRRQSLAATLYESIISLCGLVMISDNEQYEGGKRLWKRIARAKQGVAVYVLDSTNGMFYPYDGTRLQYDGANIPDAEIWSEEPDGSKHKIVLAAEKAA